MEKDDLIVGMLKVRNERLRENNIVRCLHNMQDFCSDIYAVDDCSYDGTHEYLQSLLPEDHIIRIAEKDQDFAAELKVKQQLLELIHSNGPWKYIFWMDADEVLDRDGTENIRQFCREQLGTQDLAWSFHYLQLWKNSSWYRLDDQFNEGWFVKLWRYNPELRFDVVLGTHNAQFPSQIHHAFTQNRVARSKWEVIHYGNYKTCLKWKCIQYANGLGGVERHMNFENGEYNEMPKDKFPPGAEHSAELEPKPVAFSGEYKERLLKLNNLKELKNTFCIILPTNNRAHTLERAIDSVLAQTYQDWILVVLDDASLDNTAELMDRYMDQDPRIFYAKYFDHAGGVAMNEIGMEIAVNTAEFWTRLGSDDWFGPDKLEMDYKTFINGANAVYGPFADHFQGKFNLVCNTPSPDSLTLPAFERGGFLFSWANCAVRSSILKAVKTKHGNYCRPELKNMEDVLVNYRISRLTNWMWRGIYDGNFLCNPPESMMQEMFAKKQELVKPDAYWNINEVGASANAEIYSQDRQLSTKFINEEKLI